MNDDIDDTIRWMNSLCCGGEAPTGTKTVREWDAIEPNPALSRWRRWFWSDDAPWVQFVARRMGF